MPGKSRAQLQIEEEDGTPGNPLKGRYFKAFDRRALDACMLGATNAELAQRFGVDETTIEAWIREKPSFRRAVHTGREGADERVARALHRRAVGMTITKERPFNIAGRLETVEVKEELPPDVNAAALWLSNRQRGKWRSSTAGDGAVNAFDLASFVGTLAGAAAKQLAQPGDDAKPVDPQDVVIDDKAPERK